MEAEEGESHFLIQVDGETIGTVQSYEETDPMYHHAGIDIAIRSPWQRKGLGPDAIRTLARGVTASRPGASGARPCLLQRRDDRGRVVIGWRGGIEGG